MTSTQKCVAEMIDVEVFFNATSLQTDPVDSAVETWLSSTLTTSGGATFRIQFDTTAPAGVQTFPSTDLGVMSTASDDAQFDINTDILLFGNLSIHSFESNGSGLTSGDVSLLGFFAMEFAAASGTDDSGNINGATWTDVSAPVSFSPTSEATLTHVGGVWRLDSVSVRTLAIPEPGILPLLGMLIPAALGRRSRPTFVEIY